MTRAHTRAGLITKTFKGEVGRRCSSSGGRYHGSDGGTLNVARVSGASDAPSFHPGLDLCSVQLPC